MTGPRIEWPDRGVMYGPGSSMASQQWDRATEIETQEVDRIMRFLKAQGRDIKGYGADPVAPALISQAQDTRLTAVAKPVTIEDPDDELLGQAHAWGITTEAAKSMPRKELVDQINFYRANARPTETDRGWFGAALGLASFGAGGGKMAASVLANTPLLPDVVKRVIHAHEAEQYFSELTEGVRMNIAQKDQKFATGLEVAGGLVTTWYPGVAAWKLAGVAGKAIPFASQMVGRAGYAGIIVRGASAGAATGWMMEGAGPHARQAIIGGALLGAAVEPAVALAVHYSPQISAALGRISKAFKGPADEAATATALREAEQGAPEVPGFPTQPRSPEEFAAMAQDFRTRANQPATNSEERKNLMAMAESLEAHANAKAKGPDTGGWYSTKNAPPEGGTIDYTAPSTPEEGHFFQYKDKTGTPRGFLTVEEAGPNTHNIFEVSVDPEFRRKGIATSLLQAANDRGMRLRSIGRNGLSGDGDALSRAAAAKGLVDRSTLDAEALTKRDIVSGSPRMPEIAQQTVIDDGTAVQAARDSNPGGTSVIPGVNPEQVMMGAGVEQPRDLSRLVPAGEPGVRLEPHAADATMVRVAARGPKGEPIGVLQLQKTGPNSADVMSVFVQPGARRQGVATQMYDAAEAAGLKIRSGESGFSDEGRAFVEARAAGRGETVAPIPQYHTRFASRPGSTKLDVITSHDPISDGTVAQYEKHGMYDGQEVVTASGNKGRILSIGEDGTATVELALNNGAKVPPFKTKVGKLLPQAMSENVMEEPGLYDGFKEYARMRWEQASQAMAGAKMPGWLDKATTEKLPGWIDDFLTTVGVENPNDKAKLLAYFNSRRVEDFRALAPEADAASARVQELVHNSSNGDSPYFRTPAGPMQEAREMLQRRGFNLVTEPGKSGFTIHNMTHAEAAIPVPDEAAAIEFAKTVNVDMPDFTPASTVPVEAGRRYPTSSINDPVLDNGDLGDRMGEAAIEMEANARSGEAGNAGVNGGGGSGGGGGEPPTELPRGGVPGEPAPENDALRASIERLKADSNYGRIMHQFSNGVNRRLRAMNSRMKLLEADLSAAGFDVARPWKTYQALSNANDIKHNWEAPWMDRWAGIVEKFDRKSLRSGDVVRAYEIVDDAERNAFMRAKGFSAKATTAVEEMNQFFRDIFPETGIEANREIKRYISHVSARHQQGLTGEQGYGYDMLSPYTDFFAEHVREGGVQMREMDARQLGPLYIRALGFKKFLKAPFEEHVQVWNQVLGDRDVAPLAQYMLDWTKLLRRGYVPSHDLVVDAVQAAFSPFVTLTKKESAELVGAGLSAGHNAMLGFRPDVLLRDSIQPLLAVPRVGTKLFSVMKEYATGTEATKRAMWDRALENGWVQVERPRIESPGIAERDEIIANIPGQPLPPDQRSRRLARAIGDMMWDVGAPVLRTLKNKSLTPLGLYSRLGERNRLYVGEAGYQHALEKIANFRAGKMSREDLLSDVVGTYDKPVQQRFMEMLDAGTDNQAAILMGNELANVTQFRYGSLEAPEAMRTMTGRVGMQFGNFTLQFHSFASEALRNGDLVANAKFLGWMGAVAGALELAKQQTGWNFGKWQFYNAYTFAGSPWVQVAADLARGAGAASSNLQGRDLTPEQERDMQRAGDAFGTAVGAFNPIQSGLRTIEGVGQALHSENPMDALGRLIFVGERGTNRQTQNTLQAAGDQAFETSLQPAPPGPMRALTTLSPPSFAPSAGTTQVPGTKEPVNAGTRASRTAYQQMPTREVLNAAIAGDPRALALFNPEDMDVLRGLAMVPVEDRYLLYSSYHQLRYKAGTQEPATQAPGVPGASHPAGGVFF